MTTFARFSMPAAASMRKLVRLHNVSSARACVAASTAIGAAIKAMKPRIMSIMLDRIFALRNGHLTGCARVCRAQLRQRCISVPTP